jgi:hypothetical protein
MKLNSILSSKTAFMVLVLITISIFSLTSVFASSENWSEVTSFTGEGITDYFTCEHAEWRIRWEYTGNQISLFSFYVYEKGEDVFYIDYLVKMGTQETSGVTYIHDKQGEFYMNINSVNIDAFKIIIEQDLNSIPEFTSWIILPLLLTGALIVIALKKRLIKSNNFFR